MAPGQMPREPGDAVAGRSRWAWRSSTVSPSRACSRSWAIRMKRSSITCGHMLTPYLGVMDAFLGSDADAARLAPRHIHSAMVRDTDRRFSDCPDSRQVIRLDRRYVFLQPYH